MIRIQSPFLHDIQECKVVMRKLRKKIHKHLAATPPAKKAKDHNQNLMGILKSRNLPNFVIDTLKKKRTVDFNFLKNVTVSSMATPEQISKLTSNQENEIQALFTEHKQRLRKLQKKESNIKFDKKSTNYTSESEQQEQDESINESEQISLISNFHHENGIHNQQHFHIDELSGQIRENHFQIDGLFVNGPSFMTLHKDMESDEEWLRF